MGGYGRRLAVVALFLAAVAVAAALVWSYGYRQALDPLADRGEADLTLASDRLTGQLQLYQQLAVLTAEHPDVRGLLNGHGADLRALLLAAADKTGALDVLVVGRDGLVLASAHGTRVGNVSDDPAQRMAMQGAMGEGHGVSDAGARVYEFAAPVFAASGRITGAVWVIANIERVETEWRGARPAVFFTDQGGGPVFITNRSEMLGWARVGAGFAPLPVAQGGVADLTVRRIGRHEVWQQGWSDYVPSTALYLARELPVIGMRAEALIDVGPAQRLASLQAAVVAAVCLVFGAVLWLVAERRRTLTLANARLESRVSARTAELSDANTALRREVAERIAAEAALKRAQAELVQAGKLSALGQMSAGLSHELNQPLMAIQQFAENGSAFLDRGKPERAGENLLRISDLARRMGRIIGNLRGFMRNESEPVGRVDMVSVIGQALDLTAARLTRDGVRVDWVAPDAPLWVRGGEVRLGQVMVNLISNAADAMAGRAQRVLRLRVIAGDPVAVLVGDTGGGIAEPERIFDPFYTTKEVGAAKGMGLGLSISYGLVQSFGGNITGANVAGGAELRVTLQPWSEEAAA